MKWLFSAKVLNDCVKEMFKMTKQQILASVSFTCLYIIFQLIRLLDIFIVIRLMNITKTKTYKCLKILLVQLLSNIHLIGLRALL